MMWALLDIRTGRANRMQFLALIGLCIALMYIDIPQGPTFCIGCEAHQRNGVSKTYTITVYPIIRLIIVYYLFFLALLRRLRDTGRRGHFLCIFSICYQIVFLLYGGFGFAKSFFSLLKSFGFNNSLVGIFPILLFFLPVVLGLLFFSFSIFKHGDTNPNQYGYPPKGLDFRTMVYVTYPQHLREKYQEQERLDDLLAARQEEERQQVLEKSYSESIKKSGSSLAETKEFKGRG